MGVNEPFRCIVAGHRLLIAVFVIVPLLAVVALGPGGTGQRVASARIQATSDTLGSDTEADSVLNRVRGIATSTDVVARAMHNAGLTGHAPAYVGAHEITVTRLGSSGVVDITVTDRDANFAKALAGSLAKVVVNFMRGSGNGASDSLVKKLSEQEQSLQAERSRLVTALAQAHGASTIAQYSAQLSSLDQQLGDVSGTVQQLEVAAATASTAEVISTRLTSSPLATSSVVRDILAGLGGLVAGLLVASLLEIARPRCADAHAVARELDAPMLGVLESPAAARPRLRDRRLHLRDLRPRRWRPRRWRPRRWRRSAATPPPSRLGTRPTLALRRAATKAHVGSLALLGATGNTESKELARALTLQLETSCASSNRRSNGRARSEPGPAPGNGKKTAGRQEAGSGTGSGSSSTTATREVVTTEVAPAVRVLTLEDIGAGVPGERYGLLVTARALMPAAEVRRIRDLAGATGWPVVGVLDIDGSRRRDR